MGEITEMADENTKKAKEIFQRIAQIKKNYKYGRPGHNILVTLGGFAFATFAGIFIALCARSGLMDFVQNAPQALKPTLDFLFSNGRLFYTFPAITNAYFVGTTAIDLIRKRRGISKTERKLTKKLKEKAGKLDRVLENTLSFENSRMIVRNGELKAINLDVPGKTVALPIGVTSIGNTYFGQAKNGVTKAIVLPPTVEKINFAGLPPWVELAFSSEESKARLCKDLRYNIDDGMHYIGNKKILIYGETFQSHTKKANRLIPEDNDETTWFSLSTKRRKRNDHNLYHSEGAKQARAALNSFQTLSKERQKVILDCCMDKVYTGECSIREFNAILNKTEWTKKEFLSQTERVLGSDHELYDAYYDNMAKEKKADALGIAPYFTQMVKLQKDEENKEKAAERYEKVKNHLLSRETRRAREQRGVIDVSEDTKERFIGRDLKDHNIRATASTDYHGYDNMKVATTAGENSDKIITHVSSDELSSAMKSFRERVERVRMTPARVR